MEEWKMIVVTLLSGHLLTVHFVSSTTYGIIPTSGILPHQETNGKPVGFILMCCHHNCKSVLPAAITHPENNSSQENVTSSEMVKAKPAAPSDLSMDSKMIAPKIAQKPKPETKPVTEEIIEEKPVEAKSHQSIMIMNEGGSTDAENSQKEDDHHHDHHKDENIYYKFEYAVRDDKTKDVKKQVEERKGDQVVGEYSFLEKDGYVRHVKYRADWKTGFHAEVRRLKYNPAQEL